MSLHPFRPREASVPLIFAACAGIGLFAWTPVPTQPNSAALPHGNDAPALGDPLDQSDAAT